MYFPTYLVFRLVVSLIRIIKWGELQILKLFTPLLRRKAVLMAESIGIVYLNSNERKNSENIQNGLELTPEETSRALSKCHGKYSNLCKIKVKDFDQFVLRFANSSTLGIGELYMDGAWTTADDGTELVEFFRRYFDNGLQSEYLNPWNKTLMALEYATFNLQTKQRAYQVGDEHYDLGNDLFISMLDSRMQYTCGYWANASNLEDAQLHKMELLAKKLNLKPGMRVLDVGCGWGTLCKYLAENYGVECVGITISKEGAAHGQEINEGLPVDIRIQDYRDVDEPFDRIVTVGSIEHFGPKNYREFMQMARRCLKDDEGILLIQSIGRNSSIGRSYDPWINKYIFPNGYLPNVEQIVQATKDLFVIEDWHNFGLDYAKTLNAWRQNFNQNWGKLESKYGDRFYRRWIFYLSFFESAFISREIQLWQIVLSKNGLKTDYRAAR